MIERKGYVYRFLDEKNRILYIGKTVNMSRRMRQHFSPDSHLKKNGKGDLYEKVCKIEYITCKDEFTALQKELMYINLYKPKYNSASKIRQIINPKDANDRWKLYRVVRPISREQEIQNNANKIFIPIIYIATFIFIVGYFLF